MAKNYRISFDAWALVLFAAMMAPNIIWFAMPAPIDVLRVGSTTEALDAVASVLQVLMVATLCLVKNENAEGVNLTPLVVGVIGCTLLYYACWVAYYLRFVDALVLLGLAVFPCAAFTLYAADRRNWVAFALACAFAACHLIFALANFVI